MKKKNIFIVLSLALSMLLGLTACSQDESKSSDIQPVKVQNGFYVYPVQFDCAVPGFDEDGVTRALTHDWPEKSSIMVRFLTDSKNYIGYLTYEDKSWRLLGTNDFLALDVSGTCELVYLTDNNGDNFYMNMETQCLDVYHNGTLVKNTDIPWNFSEMTITEEVAIYFGEGTYVHSTKPMFTVKATLKPLMWRLRFAGDNGTSITLPATDNDIMYCNTFKWSATDGASVTRDKKDVTLTVANGYTPYVYGFFTSTSTNKITINKGNETYSREFNASNLPLGKSGYFTIPTASNYSTYGWKRDTGGVLFEEPYCGWATSLSTVQAVVASMDYLMFDYDSVNGYFACNGKNQEFLTYYYFNKERLDQVDVDFYESVATVSDVRNYLSSTLNYTYLGDRTGDDGTKYYYYDLPDKVTRAAVYKWASSSTGTSYVSVTYYGLTDAILFEEPYTNWGASQATTRTALENMGYTVGNGGSDQDLWITESNRYKENFRTYWITQSNGLYYCVVYLNKSDVTLDNLRNYLSSVLKYKYVGVSSTDYSYSVPDGKSKVSITNSESSLYLSYSPVKTSAPSMAPSMIEEQQMKDIANQAAKMPRHETTRSTRDADSFAKDVERINKRIANRLK